MSTHPLDPLTPEELARAVEIVRKERELGSRVRFIRVDLEEPAKPDLDGGSPPNRRALVVILDNDARLGYEGIVDLEAGSVERWTPLDGIQPAISADEFVEAAEAVRADPDYREALARRGITGDALDSVHIEPWSVGIVRDLRPAAGPRALLAALVRRRRQPVRAADRAAGRGRRPERDDASCASTTTASCRSRPRAATTATARAGRIAPTCSRSRSCSRTGPASCWTAASCDGRSGGCGSASRTARAWCSTRSRYEDDGELPVRVPPRVDRRAGHPLRRPQPDHALQERLRHRRVRPRPAGQRARAGLRLPRRDPLPRLRVRRHQGRRAGAAQRHLHPRGGLRDPLEAPRRSHRPTRRRPIAPPGGVLRGDGRQLRVRLLLATSTRTARSSSRAS